MSSLKQMRKIRLNLELKYAQFICKECCQTKKCICKPESPQKCPECFQYIDKCVCIFDDTTEKSCKEK